MITQNNGSEIAGIISDAYAAILSFLCQNSAKQQRAMMTASGRSEILINGSKPKGTYKTIRPIFKSLGKKNGRKICFS